MFGVGDGDAHLAPHLPIHLHHNVNLVDFECSLVEVWPTLRVNVASKLAITDDGYWWLGGIRLELSYKRLPQLGC